MKHHLTLPALLALACLLEGFAPARSDPAPLPAPVARKVSFRADIYPLLAARCLRCHKGPAPSSGHRLDARSELLGESNGLALVEVGASQRSLLVRAVAGLVPDKVMPPEGRGKRLSPDEIALLRAWIDQGLDWDERLLSPDPVPQHWAFRPLSSPEVPKLCNFSWALNPIDAFLGAEHEKLGLSPAPEANKRTLIRRLTRDLTGLPPTPREVDDFLADDRPDAYDRLVERLLASPAYGERWGRFWLDLARWAESEGYESNHLRSHAWRYRDYVVDSFNRDRPLGQFIRQQLAGDELLPYSDENLIATGFLAAARLSSNEEDKARQRNDVLVDIVNATGTTFLGLTIHCAQCHNHKFDPIRSADYYRLMAFFVKGQPGNLMLRDPALWASWRALCPPEYEPAWQRREALLDSARRRLIADVRKGLPARTRDALDSPPDKRTPEQERLAEEADLLFQFTPTQVEKAVTGEERKLLDELKKKLAAIEKTLPERPQTFGFYSPATSPTEVGVLPMKGFYPLPYDPDWLGQAKVHLLVGGDVHRRKHALEPGWPAIFGPTPGTATSRTTLADWLADPRHPLTARVYVNRLWGWHFGRGLVATPSNFGLRGAAPSHPELLDWLAREFLRCGGSTKAVHRLIVRSRAYRQASTPHAGNARIDPDNKYLWRWVPRRLEAEGVRDVLLAVCGDLDRTPGGMGDPDEKASLRRGLYLFQKREQPPSLQGLFDGPAAAAESCPQRETSTTPLHALFLLNNPFAVARARSLARRVESTGRDPDQQVEAAFRFVLQRRPTASESEAVRRFRVKLRREESALPEARWLEHLCHALLNTNELLYLD